MTNSGATLTISEWIEQNRSTFTDLSDRIWANPELGWQEFQASRWQAELLEADGFAITRNVAGMPTAFVAEWGQGKPVLGFIGEFDALPGLSQKLQPVKEPAQEGGPGHGCGHNLLGVGEIAAAMALKHWLQASGKSATVRYYACPAEENGGGKVYMAQAGLYNDLDVGLNFHPATMNAPSKGSSVGIHPIYYCFKGRAAHAGGSPHEGRSALDAVELMNVGVNYLREHVKSDVRMHYIITEGGQAPNIVPDEAEVYYFLRAAQLDYLEEVVRRVGLVAQGAAMMTETTLETRSEVGYAPLLNNHTLADLQYQVMQRLGPVEYTPEEIDFAQQINAAFGHSNEYYIEAAIDYYKPPAKIVEMLDSRRDQPLIGLNFPAVDERLVGSGSTDVGDLSQIAPVSTLATTCFPSGCPGHSWGNAASAGSSIGHKGMLHAAKIMAGAAAELVEDPEQLAKVRQEFESKTRGKKYTAMIPEGMKPGG